MNGKEIQILFCLILIFNIFSPVKAEVVILDDSLVFANEKTYYYPNNNDRKYDPFPLYNTKIIEVYAYYKEHPKKDDKPEVWGKSFDGGTISIKLGIPNEKYLQSFPIEVKTIPDTTKYAYSTIYVGLDNKIDQYNDRLDLHYMFFDESHMNENIGPYVYMCFANFVYFTNKATVVGKTKDGITFEVNAIKGWNKIFEIKKLEPNKNGNWVVVQILKTTHVPNDYYHFAYLSPF